MTAVTAQASCSRSRSRATLCQLQSSRNSSPAPTHSVTDTDARSDMRARAPPRQSVQSDLSALRGAAAGPAAAASELFRNASILPLRRAEQPSAASSVQELSESSRADFASEPVSERRIQCRPCSDLSDAGWRCVPVGRTASVTGTHWVQFSSYSLIMNVAKGETPLKISK